MMAYQIIQQPDSEYAAMVATLKCQLIAALAIPPSFLVQKEPQEPMPDYYAEEKYAFDSAKMMLCLRTHDWQLESAKKVAV